MLGINVSFTGLREAIAKFSQNIQSEMIEYTGNVWAQDALERARKLAPVRTGALRSSLHIVRGSTNLWTITPEVPYGTFVITGVSPMPPRPPIYPVRKDALWWPGLNRPVSSVHHHPGFKGNDFIGRACEETMPGIGTKIIGFLHSLLKFN